MSIRHTMNGLTKTENKHRAVAPIIATLLMVAIAVVGGILIFVFTQGFFSESQVVGPTFDNLEIFGYDARDTGVESYDGFTLSSCGDDSGNNLIDGDCLAIFVTNKGDKAGTIDKVRVFGDTYSLVAGGSDTCTGTPGTFNIMEDDGDDVAIVNPNRDVTVCIVYEDDATGIVKIGRTIPVQLQTGNGQTSQINVVNGALRGQTSSTG